jgi:uncharacterized tellurite resistance protein B-like protein
MHQPISAEEKKSHFKNLAYLALMDGKIEETEKKLLSFIGAHMGLSDAELREVLAKPAAVAFAAPRQPAQRLAHLNEMIALMLVDKSLSRDELQFCFNIAQRLGVPADQVRNGVVALVRKHSPSKLPERIEKEIQDLLG